MRRLLTAAATASLLLVQGPAWAEGKAEFISLDPLKDSQTSPSPSSEWTHGATCNSGDVVLAKDNHWHSMVFSRAGSYWEYGGKYINVSPGVISLRDKNGKRLSAGGIVYLRRDLLKKNCD